LRCAIRTVRTPFPRVFGRFFSKKDEGIVFSGCNKKPGRRLSFPEQLQTHTEVKILKQIEGVASEGDMLVILGERPPCNPGGRGCQTAMDVFAKKHSIISKLNT